MYLKQVINPAAIRAKLEPVYQLLWHKYYFDELYVGFLVKRVLLGWNAFLARFDDLVVDRIFVDGWKDVTLVVKSAVGRFDNVVIDQMMVDGSGYAAATGGWVLRQFQTGQVQTYMAWTLAAFGAYLAIRF